MLDADLAELYGATTKAFYQAITRNRDRFPPDFMFRLTKEKQREVVTNCDHLRNLKYFKRLTGYLYRARSHYGRDYPQHPKGHHGQRLRGPSLRQTSRAGQHSQGIRPKT